MTGIIQLITASIDKVDLTKPLGAIDFIFATCLVVGFLFYLRRFPVFRVVLGAGFLLVCTLVFFLGGFTLTALVLGVTSNLIIISLPLIFAPEIRHYLEKLGRFPFLRLPAVLAKQKKESVAKNLVDCAFDLAERGIGGTLVIARKTGLGQTIETGVVIDAKFGTKLIQSLFFPKSPMHDGAVVIKDDRIVAAGCLLPISGDVKLDPPFGTRHKSGLAMTRDTDAVVILISEQRAEVSLAENNKLQVNIDRSKLLSSLEKLL